MVDPYDTPLTGRSVRQFSSWWIRTTLLWVVDPVRHFSGLWIRATLLWMVDPYYITVWWIRTLQDGGCLQHSSCFAIPVISLGDTGDIARRYLVGAWWIRQHSSDWWIRMKLFKKVDPYDTSLAGGSVRHSSRWWIHTTLLWLVDPTCQYR